MFATTLHAMAPAPGGSQAAGGPAATIMSLMPFIVIIGVFYFLILRPQQKQAKERAEMLKALQAGDSVVTAGGIHGHIAKVHDDDTLSVKIAEGVTVKMNRSAVERKSEKS
jgi:preprotein translocase subunit YajC